MLTRHAAETGVTLPLPAERLATVLRELGVGLALAQLIDSEAVPADLYGEFVESYCRIAIAVEASDA